MELAKSYSLMSEEGIEIRVAETPNREGVILSVSDKVGVVVSASLNKEMFDALFDLKYKMEVHRKAEKEGDDVPL